MSERFPLQTPEEIDEQLAALEAAGFPPSETAKFAEGIVKYTPGAHAESVVRRLVLDVFEGEALEELVASHVPIVRLPGTRYCRPIPNTLKGELSQRGVSVKHGGSGWRVSWHRGETIEGEDLCRIGLLAVWLKYMREEGGMDTPAY